MAFSGYFLDRICFAEETNIRRTLIIEFIIFEKQCERWYTCSFLYVYDMNCACPLNREKLVLGTTKSVRCPE